MVSVFRGVSFVEKQSLHTSSTNMGTLHSLSLIQSILFDRYIEVFRSTVSEIKPVKSSRPTPYDRPRSGREFGGYGGYGSGGGGYRNERSFTRGRGRGGRGGYGHYDDFYDNYREERKLLSVHVCSSVGRCDTPLALLHCVHVWA